MMPNYNPFNKSEYYYTRFGVINKKRRRYYSTRKKEHYFVKFKGFGISKSEVDLMVRNGVDHIVIKYLGAKKNVLYKIGLDEVRVQQEYEYQGDEQFIMPIKEMEKIGTEVLE